MCFVALCRLCDQSIWASKCGCSCNYLRSRVLVYLVGCWTSLCLVRNNSLSDARLPVTYQGYTHDGFCASSNFGSKVSGAFALCTSPNGHEQEHDAPMDCR